MVARMDLILVYLGCVPVGRLRAYSAHAHARVYEPFHYQTDAYNRFAHCPGGTRVNLL